MTSNSLILVIALTVAASFGAAHSGRAETRLIATAAGSACCADDDVTAPETAASVVYAGPGAAAEERDPARPVPASPRDDVAVTAPPQSGWTAFLSGFVQNAWAAR